MFEQHEYDYVIWQNRAFRFYESARLLHKNEMYAPATYCAAMSIELILKATLKYWRPNDDPEALGHSIKGLVNTVRNKVRNSKEFTVPRYFFEEQRYVQVSRYPTGDRGVGIPSTFVSDLDKVFFSAIKLTPFQHNTELVGTLSRPTSRRCRNISHHNEHVREIRRLFKIKSRPPKQGRQNKSITVEQLAELLHNG